MGKFEMMGGRGGSESPMASSSDIETGSPSPPPPPHLEEKLESLPKNTSRHTLNIYFNVSYYLLLIPFKPFYNVETGRCSLTTFSIQRILCLFVMWPLILLNILSYIIRALYLIFTVNKISAKGYFNVFAQFLYAFKELKLMWTFLKKQDKIQEYLTSINQNSLLIKKRDEKEDRFRVDWTILYILFVFFVYLANFIKLGQTLSLTPSSFITSGRTRFFLTDPLPAEDEYWTVENILLGSVDIILRLASLVNLFSTFIFFLLPFPLWKATRHFETFATHSSSSARPKHSEGWVYHRETNILEKYEELKILNESGNEAWATLTLLWILELAVKIVLEFDNSVVSSNPVDVVVLLGTQGLMIVSLMMGAEVVRMVERFKGWLITKRKSRREFFIGRSQEVRMIMEELQGSPIGIGAPGVYQLSYSFLAQLLCFIVITLFLSFPST
ncbi:unnamed protein product [Orchesella dallaii]|uniref:Odorant receptor n=1 Tax=Orchesella dallaii TaxID=48710 RepID=A0ABP1PZT1_9HEXA